MAKVSGAVVLFGIVALAGLIGKSSDPSPVATSPAVRPTTGETSYYGAPTSTGPRAVPATEAPPVVQLAAVNPKASIASAPSFTPPAPEGPRPSVPVPTASTDEPRAVRVETVRIRKEPRAKAASIGAARRGDPTVERGRKGSWIDVEFTDGRRGWIEAAALDEPRATAARSTKDAPAQKPVELEPPAIATGAAALAVAALIVQESRASYGGACGCPDDRDRGGRRCGGRSAYSRAGGRSLFCYAADVPTALIARRTDARR